LLEANYSPSEKPVLNQTHLLFKRYKRQSDLVIFR